MATKKELLLGLKELISNDEICISFQTIRQYRDMLLAQVSQMIEDECEEEVKKEVDADFVTINDTIRATKNHSFFTEHGIIEAKDLKVGDKIHFNRECSGIGTLIYEIL